MILTSTLTCPLCAAKTTETMEVNACRYLYVCPACGATLRPRPGDCCVFCSYGDVPCPPQQTGNACCTYVPFGAWTGIFTCGLGLLLHGIEGPGVEMRTS